VRYELISRLSETDQQLVLSRMSRRSFRKGDTLFHEGDPGDTLHLIEKGRVAIRPSTPNGDVVTLAVLGPGDCFGEQALLQDSARRTASAVALESVETRMLHKRDFADLRVTYPSVDLFLIEVLAAQVRRLSNQVLEALYMPAEHRVVRRLGELAVLYDEHTTPIVIPIRQDDLASLAGTTRPTANRVLNQLSDDGVVSLARGHLDIIDLPALQRRAR